jgi:hypothetical protein
MRPSQSTRPSAARRRLPWVVVVSLSAVIVSGCRDDHQQPDGASAPPSEAVERNDELEDTVRRRDATDQDRRDDGRRAESGGGDGPAVHPEARSELDDPGGEQATRDPWERPFSSTSIWNTPIGSDAEYVPANLGDVPLHELEHVYILRTSTADPARPLIRTGGWRNRCSGTEYSGRSIHLPDGWMPRPVKDTSTPNNPGVFVQPDGRTVVEVNGMGRCDPTGPLYGQYRADHNGHVIDIYGDGVLGNRGASAMSQFGGPIRHGELTSNEPIRHALDLLIWSEHLYWGGSKQNSYRWPASDSDSYAGPDRYRGTIPDLQMGSLLALPPSLTPDSLGLTTDVGRKLFAALQDYGSYVTEDAAWNATYLAVESTAIGTFPWGDAERADMARMVQHLHVVTNNTPTSIGGGGTPRQPLLPDIHPPD